MEKVREGSRGNKKTTAEYVYKRMRVVLVLVKKTPGRYSTVSAFMRQRLDPASLSSLVNSRQSLVPFLMK